MISLMQRLLFPDAKPLVERLGRNYLRNLPERPGVYLMRDAGEVHFTSERQRTCANGWRATASPIRNGCHAGTFGCCALRRGLYCRSAPTKPPRWSVKLNCSVP